MAKGVVKWFNAAKGYGFISPENSDKDIFVHYSSIISEGFRTLHEGDKVEFGIKDGQKGKEATDVVKA
ncbi:MAG: cold shock domain-containing protein [Candidatus Omnitrophica bacterium]|nr:cold shock domain-containing protein [Candidatus Omnitrophota bacterium]MDD5488004.1 cold shock domain-containing protein [Candidatus Omnitrophota bacterium]